MGVSPFLCLPTVHCPRPPTLQLRVPRLVHLLFPQRADRAFARVPPILIVPHLVLQLGNEMQQVTVLVGVMLCALVAQGLQEQQFADCAQVRIWGKKG
jgi:hypothetical protein